MIGSYPQVATGRFGQSTTIPVSDWSCQYWCIWRFKGNAGRHGRHETKRVRQIYRTPFRGPAPSSSKYGVPNDSKRNLPMGFFKNPPGISVFENFLISENFEFETVRKSNAIWALLTTSTIYNRWMRSDLKIQAVGSSICKRHSDGWVAVLHDAFD